MRIIILLFCLGFIYQPASAQVNPPPPGTTVCKIYFDYDNAGNRVKREERCVTTPSGDDVEPWVDVQIYPNPTTGPVTVQFNVFVERTIIRIFDNGGSILFEEQYFDQQSINLDLGGYTDGSYTLDIIASNVEYGDYNFIEALMVQKFD